MAQMFEVQAVNASGKTVKRVIEADSIKTARAKIRAEGLTPLKVLVSDAASMNKASAAQTISNPFGGVKDTEISYMTRQLASLIKSHVPVVESLNAMVEQEENPKLKKILGSVRQHVSEGRGLGEGFAQFPNIFDRVFINMVKAGESSGKLDVVLMRIADFLEARLKLKNKVTGAMMYPIIMVVVGAVILGIIFVYVVPQITRIFKDMKKQLPLATEILIAVSNFMQEYIVYLSLGILVVIAVVTAHIKTKAGRAQKDRLFLKLPIIGDINRKVVVSRFARTLGTMLQSGVPMLNALQITRNVVDNSVFEDIIDQCGVSVQEGRSLAYSIKQSRQFPPIVVHMVAVGEKTGELEGMLTNIGTDYDTQVDNALGTLTGLLEPMMMLGMAVVVGFIVMAVLMPIFEMNDFA
jgi:general secretion pathway protein F